MLPEKRFGWKKEAVLISSQLKDYSLKGELKKLTNQILYLLSFSPVFLIGIQVNTKDIHICFIFVTPPFLLYRCSELTLHPGYVQTTFGDNFLALRDSKNKGNSPREFPKN